MGKDARVDIEPVDGEEDGARANVDAQTSVGARSSTEGARAREKQINKARRRWASRSGGCHALELPLPLRDWPTR